MPCHQASLDPAICRVKHVLAMPLESCPSEGVESRVGPCLAVISKSRSSTTKGINRSIKHSDMEHYYQRLMQQLNRTVALAQSRTSHIYQIATDQRRPDFARYNISAHLQTEVGHKRLLNTVYVVKVCAATYLQVLTTTQISPPVQPNSPALSTWRTRQEFVNAT